MFTSSFRYLSPLPEKTSIYPKICISDPVTNTCDYLGCEEYVKYLGVLIDYRLSWTNHNDSVVLKISKTIGLLSKLRHLVPSHTLISIYNSLIAPYLRYGLIVWGQANKFLLDKLSILQKRALRFIFLLIGVITQSLFF